MKNYIIVLLCATVLLVNSCREEALVLCQDIYIPQSTNLCYFDENGKNLFFGSQKKFEIENMAIYKMVSDSIQPINFTIDKESAYITVHVEQSAQGTFFIELQAGTVQEVNYKSSIDESKLPCENYKIKEMQHNDNQGHFNPQDQVWELTYE